ncbi:MAG: hypothetical protein J6P61_06130 [Erysipelotrichaceae bacterium]|nr:hypothetical protein [Erysipelotrichaceae bacterium]
MFDLLFIIIQCTWGLCQSLLGLMMFIIHIRDPHTFKHGVVITQVKGQYSVSLGMFLFVHDKSLITHEYGHSIQSMILGPLYLFVIGIPSFLWCHLPVCQRYQAQGHDYYDFLIEKQANILGDKMLAMFSDEKKNWI